MRSHHSTFNCDLPDSLNCLSYRDAAIAVGEKSEERVEKGGTIEGFGSEFGNSKQIAEKFLPNPKLSDRGEQRGTCMVRRCGFGK
jgi:uroporphyrinogen-III synthase